MELIDYLKEYIRRVRYFYRDIQGYIEFLKKKSHYLTTLDFLIEERSASEKFDKLSCLFLSSQKKYEITGLIEYLKGDSCHVVCEIGTYHGGTSLLFCSTLPNIKLFMGVDLYVRNKSAVSYIAKKRGILYRAIDGNTKKDYTRKRIVAALNHQYIDVLFIDGDHSYDGVKSDFEYYKGLVRSGGYIVFHDIVMTTNDQPLLYVGDVPKYFNELKNSYKTKEIVENYGQGGYGIGIIKIQ